MNGVMGVTTAPPLLTTAKQAAEYLVGRNEPLRNLLRQLGLITEDYGISLTGLRDLVINSDINYRAVMAYNRAVANDVHHHLAPPPPPTATQKMFSTMSVSERARLRMLATLAPMSDDANMVGVEWSMDEVGMFCTGDPRLVEDFAAVMVARYTGVQTA